MSHRKPFPFPDPARARAMMDEADIGSGEKTPAQEETEEMIRQIPPLPHARRDERGEQESPGTNGFDTAETRGRLEHDASLLRDEPSEQLNALDPVPPKGR